MYGIWALDDAGRYPSCPPFPIPMQGLAAFACRKDAWLGFHPQFRGFGCEEWYIAEKYRRAGHQAICLPGLRWVHRFNKPKDLPVGNPPPTVEDKVWNYLLAFREFGMDPTPMIEHFGQEHPPTQKWEDLAIHYHHHLDAIGQSPSRLRQLNP